MPGVCVKVCGVTREDDVRGAVDAGADYVGFNVAPGSPRRVSVERARELAAILAKAGGSEVMPVAVCVWEEGSGDGGQSFQDALATGFGVVQVHGLGENDEAAIAKARAAIDGGRMFVRALSVRRALTAEVFRFGGDSEEARGRGGGGGGGGRAVLVDTPGAQGVQGGTGRVFDWSLLSAVRGRKDLWLAGGLRPENVAEAVRAVNPGVVDVASGVERSPGVKDAAMMARFVDEAKHGKDA